MKKTKNEISQSLPMLIFIILSGGLQDAYSYFCRDGVFANAQTGNIVFLSVNIVNGDAGGVVKYLVPVAFFALGAIIAKTLFFVLKKKRGRVLEADRAYYRVGRTACGGVYAAEYEFVRQRADFVCVRGAGAYFRPDLRQRFCKHDVHRQYRKGVGRARNGDCAKG